MPPPSSSAATIEVVVVLPWVPATATFDFSRISSASISARRTTGRFFARAASSSGLPRLDRRGDHHDVRALEVLRLLADEDARALRRQPLGDRRGLQVRALHGEAVVQQHLGDARHADAADAGEVDRPDVVGEPGLSVHALPSFLAPGPRPAPPDVRSRPGAPGAEARLRHRARALRVGQDRGDVPRQPLRRQLLLADHEGAAGGDQPAGVRRLVVVGRRRRRGSGSPAGRSR